MTSVLLAVIVFLMAMIAVIGFSAILHWRQHHTTSLLPYTFYLTILNVGLQAATISGRNLFSSPTTDGNAVTTVVSLPLDLPPVVLLLSRLTSLIIPLVAIERIVNRLMHYGEGERLPMALLLGLIFYFTTSVLFSAFLGSHPSLSHQYFYLFVAGLAALLSTEADGDKAICSARNAIFVLLLVSALYLAIKPELVMQNHYTAGLIPGLTIRYAGLTGSANTIGSLVVVYLLCLRTRPYSRVWLNHCAWLIGLATLIIAQSKTSWITFLLGMACLAYFRNSGFLKRHFFDFRRPIFFAGFLSMGMIVVTGIAVTVMFGPTSNPLNSFFVTQSGAELMTLTGRDQIWAVAVREWHRNPLFGYGLTIWNDAYQARIGIPGAVHAHNQFYQTLSSAGIVGVVGLLVYVLTLFWFVLKTARVSQGLTLALFVMLMFRSVSEITLTMVGYFGTDELTHSLILMLIAACLPRCTNVVIPPIPS